jgi:cell division protein FtsL
MMGAAINNGLRSFFISVQGSLIVLMIIGTLVSSAVAVAYSAHKSRQYLNDLQKLEVERDRLGVEWGQLLLEQHTWGAYGRIGKLATEQLQMRNPAPTEIIMVRR